MSRSPEQLLADITAACQKIIRHTEGRSRDEAFADELLLDGILLNLHVIGEAVKALPAELKSRNADVPWRRIAGMRDFIAHAYFAVVASAGSRCSYVNNSGVEELNVPPPHFVLVGLMTPAVE